MQTDQPRPLSDETLYADPERLDEFDLECRRPGGASARRPSERLGPAQHEPPDEPDYDDWLSTLTAVAGLVLLGLVLVVAWLPMAQAGDDWTPGLELRDAQTGQPASALQLGSEANLQISGMIARVTVVQEYRNPTAQWQQGLYLFPLPERAAVDRLRMRIGERVIEGQIQEKRQARATYERARTEGKRTGLVQQKRPNMFTTEVANIGPGETVRIEIEYQQTVAYADGRFELRFPMVVGPRYAAKPVALEAFDAGGWAQVAEEPVPEVPYRERTAQRLKLSVDLDAGLPLDAVESAYHAVYSTQTAPGRYRIALAEGQVPVDRDFVLRWTPAPSAQPQAALFSEQREDGTHLLLMFVPPAVLADDAVALPREVVFVIDTSGSMHGPSIIQARAALDLALAQLRPQDRFNVIQFNSVMERLHPQAVPATPAALRRARDYVAGLQADGGTEMAPALEAALTPIGPAGRDDGALRQVVFLTDGSVGNEQALFAIIRARLGDSRLFTVGIGSAPNAHFMREAARYGRGTFTFIGDTAEVEAQMAALFRKLQSPVLKDIRVVWPAGAQADMQPERIPDLYAGEPLLLHAKLAQLDGGVTLSGQSAGRPWTTTLALQGGAPRAGIATAWARARLATLDDRLGDDRDGSVQRAMTELALAHHLVSRFTSLVAVDVTPILPTRPDGATLEGGALPLAMPAGWNYQKVFGQLPQTATPAALHFIYGAIALAGAALARRRRARA